MSVDHPTCPRGGTEGTVPLGYACAFDAGHEGPCAPWAAEAGRCKCNRFRILARRGIAVCPACDFPAGLQR